MECSLGTPGSWAVQRGGVEIWLAIRLATGQMWFKLLQCGKARFFNDLPAQCKTIDVWCLAVFSWSGIQTFMSFMSWQRHIDNVHNCTILLKVKTVVSTICLLTCFLKIHCLLQVKSFSLTSHSVVPALMKLSSFSFGASSRDPQWQASAQILFSNV